MAGRLREGDFTTTHLTRFNGGAPVAAAVGDKEYLLLWQPEDSPHPGDALVRAAAGWGICPEGMVQEASGRDVLARILLPSPRLVSIGWLQMRAASKAAAAAGDREAAARSGRALGTVLGLARAEGGGAVRLRVDGGPA